MQHLAPLQLFDSRILAAIVAFYRKPGRTKSHILADETSCRLTWSRPKRLTRAQLSSRAIDRRVSSVRNNCRPPSAFDLQEEYIEKLISERDESRLEYDCSDYAGGLFHMYEPVKIRE